MQERVQRQEWDSAPRTVRRGEKMIEDNREYLDECVQRIQQVVPDDLPGLFGVLCEALLAKRERIEADIIRNERFGRQYLADRLKVQWERNDRMYQVAIGMMKLMAARAFRDATSQRLAEFMKTLADDLFRDFAAGKLRPIVPVVES